MTEAMLQRIIEELTTIRTGQAELASGQELLTNRVVAMEDKPEVKPEVVKSEVVSNGGASSGAGQYQIIQGSAKEKSLQLTFGGGGGGTSALLQLYDSLQTTTTWLKARM